MQPVNHAGRKRTSNAWRASDSIRSWSWEGHEGRPAVVEVYADADRVELLLDGAVVGAKPVGVENGYLAEFTVPYRRGTLTAVAYDADGGEIGQDTLDQRGSRAETAVGLRDRRIAR